MSTRLNQRIVRESEDLNHLRLSDMFQMLDFRTLFGSHDVDDIVAATDLTSSTASYDDRPRHRRLPRRTVSRSRADIAQQFAEECMCCLIVPLFFFFLVALSMILGQYRSTVVDMGPNLSRILDADLVYVKDIMNINTSSSVAPVLYGFIQRPQLDQERDLSYDLKYNLLSSDYQTRKVWLNNGSKVELKYDIYSTHIFYILLVVLRGEETLRDWTSDPLNPRLAASWHNVHGSGVINFEADKDGEYYFTLGNLNDYNVEVLLQTTVHAKVYDTQAADLSCSLRDNLCGLNLLFPSFNFALLSTPDPEKEGAIEKWQVLIVYGQRWILYVILIGFMLSMAFLSLKVIDKICNMISMHDEPVEHATSVSPTSNPREPLLLAQQNSHIQTDHEVDEITSENEKKIYESRFCANCCNETRSTFFHPCGHCVTCYACGLRIQNGETKENDLPGKCPVCRLEIKEVKRIFTV